MAKPTLQQLRYFLSAARHKTLSAAAEAEHIAQPSLSEQIRRLEGSLGVSLFTRTNRELQLTEAARLLLPLAERALAEVDNLAEAVREVRTLQGGTVSFGTFNSAHLYLLTGLIRDFHWQYPKVKIRVVGLNSSEVADAVRSGELEAGLVQLPVDDRGLSIGHPVLKDEVVYVSAEPKRLQRPITIEELAVAPLILSEARWSDSDPLRKVMTERAQHAGVTLDPVAEVEFQTHALELAAQGVGDSLVSYHVAKSMLETHGMGYVPLEPPVDEYFAFITRQNGALSPATKEFMKHANRHISLLRATSGREHQ
ncbi:LysR family transcriptional regulator [Arthrobacter sp. 18067]|uniref:LysR family transcriptional regulator n=1 Tax=Arthrobacter sp. 18067 TaxID=2681413 RepID=UPI001357C81B|nr:LysR family transcriptional regulator [Arthrobacter sp. 18067]